MMTTRAAVLSQTGAKLRVEIVRLDEPGPDELLVRVEAAGVCHSDLHYMSGALRSPLPFVPGHEGVGVVEAVGSKVTSVQPGDRVCLMWRPRCGECTYCLSGRPSLCQLGRIHRSQGGLLDGTSRLHRTDGSRLHHLLGVSCFAEHAVVSERAVVPIPRDVPSDVAAITGCAVITGVGAVLNTVRSCAGQSLAIFGAGGVGLSSVLGAVLCGAHQIIVVDVVRARLDVAAELGATHLIDASTEDTRKRLLEICPDGLDWTIEAIGSPQRLEDAFVSLRPGGTLVAVGLSAVDTTFALPLNALVQQQKHIIGSLYGSSNPLLDIPRILELHRASRLPLDRLMGHTYRLDEINTAFEDLVSGAVGRGVIRMEQAA